MTRIAVVCSLMLAACSAPPEEARRSPSPTPPPVAPADPPLPADDSEEEAPPDPPAPIAAPAPATAADPLTRFVEHEVSSGGMWINNGIDPPLVDAPATTSIEAVVDLVYERHRYARLYDHPVLAHRIIERREVDLNGDGSPDYTALWMDRNLGECILLLRPTDHGWYNREFALVE